MNDFNDPRQEWHLGDMSKKGVQFFVGAEDAILSWPLSGRTPSLLDCHLGRGLRTFPNTR
jgi:hypothetical protein